MRIDHRGSPPKRVTDKEVAEGDRAATAAHIGGAGRVGDLDGVRVDFRHPELPPEEWEARPWWHVWGDPPTSAAILFPNEAAHGSEEDLRGMKGGLCIPLVAAQPGDTITVESVVAEISDRRFDHQHDAQRRLAYLRIERPDGSLLHPPGPLAFMGITQIRHGATRESFDNIVARICAHAGRTTPYVECANGNHVGDWGWDMPLEEIARHVAADAHDAYFELLGQLPDEGMARAYLRNVINSAALAGFLLGKVEARRPERTAAAVAEAAERGAAKVTRVDWRERAIALWKENPTWTKNRVANAIAEGTDDAPRSIIRGIEHLVPETSPSFKRV